MIMKKPLRVLMLTVVCKLCGKKPPVLPCIILQSYVFWVERLETLRHGFNKPLAWSLSSIGVYLIVEGKLTQGALIACYMISTRALAPIAQVAGLLTQYYQASSALNLLNKTVEAEQERENLKVGLVIPI